MILTPEELIAITRRDRPSAQARVLRLLGVPFAVHPADGVLIVARAAVEERLRVKVGSDVAAEFSVNLEGVRAHGKASGHHKFN